MRKSAAGDVTMRVYVVPKPVAMAQKNMRRLYFQQKESGPEGDWHCHVQSPVHGQPSSSRHSPAD
jgi:hypothetical protein